MKYIYINKYGVFIYTWKVRCVLVIEAINDKAFSVYFKNIPFKRIRCVHMICDIRTTKSCKSCSQFLSLEKEKVPYTFRNYFLKAVKDGKEYEQEEKDITMTTQNKFYKQNTN